MKFLFQFRTCRPSKKVTLSSLYSMEGRDHVKAVYPVASWEDSSEFLDLTRIGPHSDMVVKITLTATAYDEAREEDFDSFLERFTSNNRVDQNSPDFKIIMSIVGGSDENRSGWSKPIFISAGEHSSAQVAELGRSSPQFGQIRLAGYIFTVLRSLY